MRRSVSFFLLVLAGASPLPAQKPNDSPFAGLAWRSLGPSRGGRVAAVCGVPGDRDTYWFGACGGGVWKTTDAGTSWRNVSDGFFGGSIGAVAVAESDPNVVYVGGGEKTVRGNVSHGNGVYKSTDNGKTWKHVGLADTRHIPRIRVHPKDPDLVYVAALGHLFGPNDERGVYRSRDGGQTWQRVLFANADAGAIDLCLDARNPRILYASTWRVRRTPWSLESGGEGSDLWKSTDGGDTWTKLTGSDEVKGLPKGTRGIIGVCVSPADPERVYSIVEAEDGGVFRSDDGGKAWRRTNQERSLRQRAWYYTRIYADPSDADVVYVVNVAFWRSKDGGRTFTRIGTPHGDNHDLWIAPEDPRRMVEGNDGGANVSFDGGKTWSRQDNQPTAQFYRVTTDNHFPYRVYGAQQDNSTLRLEHRGGGGRGGRDFEVTAGGESGWLAPHPKDPDLVFGGSYGGYLQMLNHRTGERRNVNVWPDEPIGHGAGDQRYRFQWNFPLFFSPHEPFALYAAGNVLFRSDDLGHSWTPLSPDLSRNDPSKLGASGGPITKDNTSVEYYGTIFAVALSRHERGVLWCGTDDGRVHVTRDGGQAWRDVTPSHLPEWAQINSIEAHPFEPGGAYLAATRYKLDDLRPYLYRTTDWGATWTPIAEGLAPDHFTRVVRADPKRRGLLYAGTESGVHVSLDDGASWQSLQLELPAVPITDLCLRDDDLIAATQGRSFWILDDVSPLQSWADKPTEARAWLFPPRAAWRGSGASLYFWLAELPGKDQRVKLSFLDAEGNLVRAFESAPDGAKPFDADEADGGEGGRRGRGGVERGPGRLEVKKGLNRFVWNQRHEGALTDRSIVLWGGGTGGPLVLPGQLRVRLEAPGETGLAQLEIKADPRASASLDDLRAQHAFLIAARDKLTETHQAVLDIRRLRSQVQEAAKRAKDAGGGKDVAAAAEALAGRLTAIEEALHQTKNQSNQDPLNYPVRLNNKLSSLVSVVGMGDFPPTKQAEAVRDEVVAAIDAKLAELRALLGSELAAFNELVAGQKLPAVK